MKLLKKLLGVREKEVSEKIVTVNESSEELTRRLKEFDNQALQNQIKMLEKVVTFLAQKVEVQSEVLRRQTDAIKELNTTIEEIANVFEAVQKIAIISQETKTEEEVKDKPKEIKKYYN
jgi:hypothetical protein